MNRAPVDRMGKAVLVLSLVACVVAGCAPTPHRLEVRWYTPMAEPSGDSPSGALESYVELRNSRCAMPSLASATAGEREGNYTAFALPSGNYEFEYTLPETGEMIYGELDVHGSCHRAFQEFIRRTFVTIGPGAPGGDPGFAAVLSQEDLDRVRQGDMVEKVVFIADLRAVDRRLDMIEQELRRIRDLEARMGGQLEYWKVKLAERRRNAFYNSEYGVDIPSGGLASLQSLVGAETYHWVRYTEADDKVRSYEEEIARLALPAERLREERAALRGITASTKIIHRRNEMMLATFRMQRPTFDMIEEIRKDRDTLQGPKETLEDPYAISSISKSLGYPRGLETRTRMPEKDKTIGDVVMEIRLGSRKPSGR